MKIRTFIALFLCFLAFSSCSPSIDPAQQITLAQAFAHCTSTTSYWVSLGVVVLLSGGLLFGLYKASKTSAVSIGLQVAAVVVILFAIGIAIFARPCDVMVNTSVEMMNRGHFLGY